MRKLVALILGGAALSVSAGCVMVIGVPYREYRDTVEVNGEMYRIDDETGQAHKIHSASDRHDDASKRDTDK